jgi:hypothetical protein
VAVADIRPYSEYRMITIPAATMVV